MLDVGTLAREAQGEALIRWTGWLRLNLSVTIIIILLLYLGKANIMN
jgi:hypothetical protein